MMTVALGKISLIIAIYPAFMSVQTIFTFNRSFSGYLDLKWFTIVAFLWFVSISITLWVKASQYIKLKWPSTSLVDLNSSRHRYSGNLEDGLLVSDSNNSFWILYTVISLILHSLAIDFLDASNVNRYITSRFNSSEIVDFPLVIDVSAVEYWLQFLQ